MGALREIAEQLLVNSGDPVNCTCEIVNKQAGVRHYIELMLNRTNQMFEYQNLPDTIPAYQLELMLQSFGTVAIAKVKGELYALYGNAGGAPDPYRRPTMFVAANPALGWSGNLRILNHLPPFDTVNWNAMEPCVLVRNDTRMCGLLPIFSRYATQLVENEVSIRSAQINARQQSAIAATDGPEIESARQWITDLEAGKIGAIAERAFIDGIKVFNVGTQSSNSIIQLIELQQYLKASWYNDLGLNANFNMKREYMSEEEIAVSTDMLLPLVDDMLMCRQTAIEIVNKEFGTDISVDKNSAWQDKEREVEASLGQSEAETQVAQREAKSTETEEKKPEEEKKDE